MYQIMCEGQVIAYVEKPRYIKVGRSGSYCEASPGEAQGVAVHSVAYNLPGHDEIAGGKTATIREVSDRDMTDSLTAWNILLGE